MKLHRFGQVRGSALQGSMVAVALALGLGFGGCTTPAEEKPVDVEQTGGRSGSGTGGSRGQGSGGSTGSGGNTSGSGGQTGGANSGGSNGSGGSSGSGSGGSAAGGSAAGGSGGQGGPDAAPASDASAGPPGGGGGAAEPPEAATPGMTDLAKHRFSKAIKIESVGLAGDVKAYPVAVILNAANFDFTQAKPLGQDVRFSTMEGGLLPYSIEQWDPAGKKAALWVLMDVKAAGQTFLMHFGNPDAESAARSKDVFSKEAGFLGVYHLNQDGNEKENGYPDASWNEVHGVGVKMMPGSLAEGRIGPGTQLKNPGGGGANAQWVKVDGPKVKTDFNGTATHPITATIWAWADSFAGYYETVFSKGDVSWSLQRDYQGRMEACTRVPGYHACAITAKPTTKVWVHYMVIQKPGNLRLFVNGKQVAQTGGTSQYGDHAFGIGNQTQYNMTAAWKRGWDGILDEARVMGVERSPDWAKLDYESQKPDAKFLTFGPAMMK